MEIKSKFQLGQEVFYFTNDFKIVKGTIFAINEDKITSIGYGFITYEKLNIRVHYKYWIRGENNLIGKKNEDELFRTKEELISSL